MILNGGFEQGLKGWHVVSGMAFRDQPVAAASILAQGVRIDGAPVVSLGGDFWHVPYPIGQDGDFLICSIGKPFGVLESDTFELSLPYLAFRLGGSASGGASIELRVPVKWAEQSTDFPALDQPDRDGLVAVRRASPTGSDVLRELGWNLEGTNGTNGLVGSPARIQLRIDGPGVHRLLVDHIRLLPTPPPPFHPPLWGWADLHCHPMAQAGFGGLLAGHMHGPVEDLGSCVLDHGVNHSNVAFHPIPALTESGGNRGNDGSLTVPGWTMRSPPPGEQFGFKGWPAFDDLTHIKVHQDWIRRAYDGGQRLMVALIVHSELLADVMRAPQTDRDTVEPQVQMLREFVAHNRAWCGLAQTPEQARTLIEANKLAFVLGLETDTINGWIDASEFGADPGQPNRDAIHAVLHPYFVYLRDLGIVQVNLLHLSNNAFGGMALYDFMFMINSWWRTKSMPTIEDGFDLRPEEDQISRKVTVGSAAWGKLDSLALNLGFPPPSQVQGPWTPNGDRNAVGLTVAGEVALLEAMRLGMVIDLDHMSEKSAETAHMIATSAPAAAPYPLVSAHNGARRMAPRALDPTLPTPTALPPDPPIPPSEFRRASHVHPNENAKSNTQLQWIKDTGGMFGHGTAGADSRGWGAVANDCPGSDKTFAQGYQYVRDFLGIPVGFGTDWNSLLEGPAPRFGPRAAHGLAAEAGATAAALRGSVRDERMADARAQTAGVLYSTTLRDWRKHRFADPELYVGSPVEGEGHHLWQVMAIIEAQIEVPAADALELLSEEVRELVLGIRGQASTATTPTAAEYHRAGSLMNDPTATPTMLLQEVKHVRSLVTALREVDASWKAMRSPGPPAIAPAPEVPPQSVLLTRSTAGPIRDFDYNLDGLAHYGMLPDMLQDLRNVGFPPGAMADLFASAEQYIRVWEASDAIAKTLPHP
jgi:hypothetical protein